MYPSTSKYARRGVGNVSGTLPLPTRPTTAPPGTPLKIVVMGRRAARGEATFHPADARFEGDQRPFDFVRRKTG